MQQKEETKADYSEPVLEEWGTVADQTQTGLTIPGEDGKEGSVLSQGG